jgi:hypothetical protein
MEGVMRLQDKISKKTIGRVKEARLEAAEGIIVPPGAMPAAV